MYMYLSFLSCEIISEQIVFIFVHVCLLFFFLKIISSYLHTDNFLVCVIICLIFHDFGQTQVTFYSNQAPSRVHIIKKEKFIIRCKIVYVPVVYLISFISQSKLSLIKDRVIMIRLTENDPYSY